MSEKILLVDDETLVLESMRRQLRNRFEIVTAQSGEEALEALKTQGPFSIIVSDLRMPGMDGIQLLSLVKEMYPETVRIMLTGNAEQETAVEAVNTGQIFRFLNKPCSTATLATALALAERQYKLIIAEKELLNETLKGSMKVLSELLGQTNATIFGAGSRIKELVTRLCDQLHLANAWQYEIAALMSQVGCITLPSDILHKLYSGVELTAAERRMYEQHPQVGQELFSHIPRMEKVAAMIGKQLQRMDEYTDDAVSLVDEEVCRGAQLLRVSIDYDRLGYQGLVHKIIVQGMKKKQGVYNQEILDALAGLHIKRGQGKVMSLMVKDIQTGMVVEEDVFANNGVMVVPRGQVVTWPILQGLDNFSKQVGIQEPVCVRTEEIEAEK
ncbi:MAG: response regulator [Desulfobulbaceae bacterium]|nr:response regulator [Desulfobulbaceae bacterium]